MSLSSRRYGVEQEVFLPLAYDPLLQGATPSHKVAALLRHYNLPAMADLDLRAEPKRFDRSTLWVTEADSSLGDTSWCLEEGAEVVSPILQGERDLRQLETVTRHLQAHGFITDPRTSVHVHHEATDLDLDAWKRLMLNYALVEPALDRLMNNDRRGNQNPFAYSTRQPHAVDTLNDRIQAAKTLTDVSNLIFMGGGPVEYTKLNVQTLPVHGTVEFRQHHGTLDPDAVGHWVRLSQAFVDFSAHQPTLLTVSDNVTDPEAAWQESMTDDAQVQEQLLGKVISLAGPKTKQYYMGVLQDREQCLSAPVANAAAPIPFRMAG
ncbi:MAG: amidoligase family protein [Pseudomonadota bacterium]